MSKVTIEENGVFIDGKRLENVLETKVEDRAGFKPTLTITAYLDEWGKLLGGCKCSGGCGHGAGEDDPLIFPIPGKEDLAMGSYSWSRKMLEEGRRVRHENFASHIWCAMGDGGETFWNTGGLVTKQMLDLDHANRETGWSIYNG